MEFATEISSKQDQGNYGTNWLLHANGEKNKCGEISVFTEHLCRFCWRKWILLQICETFANFYHVFWPIIITGHCNMISAFTLRKSSYLQNKYLKDTLYFEHRSSLSVRIRI
jgi:hypothetical protein